MADSFDPISLSESGATENLVSPGRAESGLHLYVSHPRVSELPEEGCITFRFKRGPRTVTEGDSGIARASVDLRLTEICDVEAHESDDEPKEDPLDELFKKAASEAEKE